MKKIFAIIMCAIIMCALPVVAFADEAVSTTTEEATPLDTEVIATETEATSPETVVIPPVVSDSVKEAELTTEKIVGYVKSHLEEISVILTMILTVFYQVRKHSALNKSIATLNNNSIAITQNSNSNIQQALKSVEGVSSTVSNYKDELAVLLNEVRQNATEKKRLESALVEVESYLKTSKLANVELANEVAELLVLANIPTSKKDELYSRHRAAVDAINAVDIATGTTEVKGDDRQEA